MASTWLWQRQCRTFRTTAIIRVRSARKRSGLLGLKGREWDCWTQSSEPLGMVQWKSEDIQIFHDNSSSQVEPGFCPRRIGDWGKDTMTMRSLCIPTVVVGLHKIWFSLVCSWMAILANKNAVFSFFQLFDSRKKKHWCFVSCMFFEPFGWVALSTDTTTVCENSPSRVAGSLSSHSSWQAGAGGLWKIPTARFGILFPPTSRLTRGKWVEDYGCSQDPAKKTWKQELGTRIERRLLF